MSSTIQFYTLIVPGIVACTCNLATLEAEVQNSVGSNPVGGTYREPTDIGELNFETATTVW